MSEQIYNKLVRDRIPEIIESKGEVPHTRILDNREYQTELGNKMVEEAEEAAAAVKQDSREDLINELADITEVRNALMKEFDISEAEVESKRAEKAENRGAFNQKILLIKTVEPEEDTLPPR